MKESKKKEDGGINPPLQKARSATRGFKSAKKKDSH
jgi:hypothetical protein